jgi:hypothetical protein
MRETLQAIHDYTLEFLMLLLGLGWLLESLIEEIKKPNKKP